MPASCQLLFGSDGAWSCLHRFEGFAIDADEVPERAEEPVRVPVPAALAEVGGGLGVRAGGVDHDMMPSVAYRLDHAGRGLTVSGDLDGRRETLVALAHGSDVLVYDQSLPRRDLEHGHLPSPPEATAANAAVTGVGTLVLSHLMGPAAASIGQLYRVVGERFSGRVVVASDLWTLEV